MADKFRPVIAVRHHRPEVLRFKCTHTSGARRGASIARLRKDGVAAQVETRALCASARAARTVLPRTVYLPCGTACAVPSVRCEARSSGRNRSQPIRPPSCLANQSPPREPQHKAKSKFKELVAPHPVHEAGTVNPGRSGLTPNQPGLRLRGASSDRPQLPLAKANPRRKEG